MTDLPYFPLYPSDWLLETKSLTLVEKGALLELACSMHSSQKRGYLLFNGGPMPLERVARVLGSDRQTAQDILDSLLNSGVLQKELDSGVLFYQPMVKREAIRKIRQEVGRKGAEVTNGPNFAAANSRQTIQQNTGNGNGNSIGNSDSEIPEGKVSKGEGELSPLGRRIAGWFGRRESTVWSEKELKALKTVEKSNTPEEDVALLEVRYQSHAPYTRREILTLLNNWPGEIDIAKAAPNRNGEQKPAEPAWKTLQLLEDLLFKQKDDLKFVEEEKKAALRADIADTQRRIQQLKGELA